MIQNEMEEIGDHWHIHLFIFVYTTPHKRTRTVAHSHRRFDVFAYRSITIYVHLDGRRVSIGPLASADSSGQLLNVY